MDGSGILEAAEEFSFARVLAKYFFDFPRQCWPPFDNGIRPTAIVSHLSKSFGTLSVDIGPHADFFRVGRGATHPIHQALQLIPELPVPVCMAVRKHAIYRQRSTVISANTRLTILSVPAGHFVDKVLPLSRTKIQRAAIHGD